MSKENFKPTAWDNIKQFLIAVVMLIFVKTSIVEAYKIPSSSMEDTLLVGDFLIANKFMYGSRLPFVDWRLPAVDDPEPGDVVIFIYPGDGVTKYIKRCVAGPGDIVEVVDKQLFVNGAPFEDPEFSKYVDTLPDGRQRIQRNQRRDNFGPYTVPPDSYFMMGDNRDNSLDSRFWGPVKKDLVLGQAMIIHWSWDDEALPGPKVDRSDPLSVPRLFLYDAIHFFEKVRWARLGSIIG
ncbi:MAG: signal peptidase I [bacterium]|nr:signal peptidase I [bacterium]